MRLSRSADATTRGSGLETSMRAFVTLSAVCCLFVSLAGAGPASALDSFMWSTA